MIQTSGDMTGDMDTESAYYPSVDSAFEMLGDLWNELPDEASIELPCDPLIGLLSELPSG